MHLFLKSSAGRVRKQNSHFKLLPVSEISSSIRFICADDNGRELVPSLTSTLTDSSSNLGGRPDAVLETKEMEGVMEGSEVDEVVFVVSDELLEVVAVVESPEVVEMTEGTVGKPEDKEDGGTSGFSSIGGSSM